MIIILAALLDVPTEQYEAAELDGAGPVPPVLARHAAVDLAGAAVRRGQLDHLRPAVLHPGDRRRRRRPPAPADVAGNSKLIGAPQNSTLTYPIWLYVQGFRYFNMGYAAAMAVLLFIVSFAFTWILVRQLRAGKAEHQEEGA